MESAFNRFDGRIGHPGKAEGLGGAQLGTGLDGPRRAGAQSPASASRGMGVRFLVPIIFFAICALAGGVLAVQRLVSPPEAVTPASDDESMGNADGLWFTVQSAVWVRQQRMQDRRVQASASSNPATGPGALQVELKVQNRSNATRILGPHDFRLQFQDGTTSVPTGRSFPLTTLGPRQYLHTVLAFDISESASGLQLVWNRSGHEVRLLIGRATFARGGAEPNVDEASSCLPTVDVRCAGGPRPSLNRVEGTQ